MGFTLNTEIGVNEVTAAKQARPIPAGKDTRNRSPSAMSLNQHY
jgi:hypothetical protein